MLLFSDLDGTLIDEHQQLSDINRKKCINYKIMVIRLLYVQVEIY